MLEEGGSGGGEEGCGEGGTLVGASSSSLPGAGLG